jgi:hypothetical protein
MIWEGRRKGAGTEESPVAGRHRFGYGHLFTEGGIMAWSKKEGNRSPIRKPLMPQAGDSLAARADELAWDRVLFPMMLAAAAR